MPDDKDRIDLGAELGVSESLLNDIRLATESEQQRRAKIEKESKPGTSLQEFFKKYVVILAVVAIIILAVSLSSTFKTGGSKISNQTGGGYLTPGSKSAAPTIQNPMQRKNNNFQAPQRAQRQGMPSRRPVNPAPPPPVDDGYGSDTQQNM